jgi:type VI secretion system protein ImpJ
MTIRTSAIDNNSFQIDSGAFWFSDSTYTVVGENAVVAPRNFKDAWVDGERPMMVYLGLKHTGEKSSNVTEITTDDDLAGVNTRYVCMKEPDVVKDFNTGENPVPVRRMSYLLRLFFQDEVDTLGNYDLIPVARIERTSDSVHLSKTYIPPSVTLDGSVILSGMIRELGDRLAFRGNELEALKRKRGVHSAEFGSRDMVYLLALRSFNRYIPYFHYIHEGRYVHPHDVYMTIRQLVGELSAFSDTIDVFGTDEVTNVVLPAYDHYDLRTCFSRALSVISRLIDEITAGPEFIVDLKHDGQCYTGPLKPEYFEGNNHYYLVMRTQTDAKQILEAMDINVKIGSLTILPVLIEQSLPGAQAEYLPVPPQELPRHRDAFYFKVDNHGEKWHAIEKEKTLGVHWDMAPEDLRMELMIVRRR